MYEFLQETVTRNMTTGVKFVAPEMTMRDLHRMFAADDYDAYPVLSNGALVGMVSKLDALKPFAFTSDRILPHYDDLMETTVDKVMCRDLLVVDAETPLSRVLQTMIAHRVKSLPVVDSIGRLVGIIAREDVLGALDRCSHRESVADPGSEPLQYRQTT